MMRRAQPALTVYVATLVLTSVWLLFIGEDAAESFLASQSTTLVNLAADPVSVLISSAFWLAEPTQLLVLAAAVPLLAVAERRLGTRKWLRTFVIGHVGASLVVAAAVAGAIATGLLADTYASGVDVGFSYGAAAVVAAALPHSTPRQASVVRGVLVLALVLDVLVGGDLVTTGGHIVAALIGHACASWGAGAALTREDWEPAALTEHHAPTTRELAAAGR
ncbi:MAG: hypothetical protein Q4G43_05955 [Mobilicoccus sp.]|nr:hypothetical protein [Mobilicoccus sp.]